MGFNSGFKGLRDRSPLLVCGLYCYYFSSSDYTTLNVWTTRKNYLKIMEQEAVVAEFNIILEFTWTE